MNVYGFVILKSQDTILAKINYVGYTNTPVINKNKELIVSYPKELEKYTYDRNILLKSIQEFYFGFPRKLNIVEKYQNRYVNLEKIDGGKYSVYKNEVVSGGGNFISTPNSNGVIGTNQTAPLVTTTLFISKNDESLICIDGNKGEKKSKLVKLLEGELDEKKLTKIKTSNFKSSSSSKK